MIRSTVDKTALPLSARACSREELLGSEWICRPRPEAVEGELRLLVRVYIDEDVVVFLLWRLAFPIEVWRIVSGHLDAGSSRQDWILFRAPTAKHQILDAIYIVDFGGVDVPI